MGTNPRRLRITPEAKRKLSELLAEHSPNALKRAAVAAFKSKFPDISFKDERFLDFFLGFFVASKRVLVAPLES